MRRITISTEELPVEVELTDRRKSKTVVYVARRGRKNDGHSMMLNNHAEEGGKESTK